MSSTCGRLLVLGGNPLHGSDALDSRMGACLWDLSLGYRTGDGRFDGETFFGWVVDFFLGGRGGKRKYQGTVNRVGRWTTRAFKHPHFVLYYILRSGSFAAACLQSVTKGVLDLDDLGRHVSSSDFDSPST
jgi:hypothetical protein